MKRMKPTLWLSFGLVLLTIALTLTGYVFGLVPDGYKAELEARAKVAEALAVQVAGAANLRSPEILHETLASVVKRNKDVLSIALRKADKSIIVQAGDHAQHWRPIVGGKSTPTHVSVPLLGEEGRVGSIELAFTPALSGKLIAGFPVTLLLLILYLSAAGFLGYFLILKRALSELDPGRVIPERVQKAFDTLSESVIIIDEKERILLTNTAFQHIHGAGELEPGTKINQLPWRMADGSALAGGYPWHIALHEGLDAHVETLSLRTQGGEIFNFDTKATTIATDDGKTLGAIVTLNDETQAKQTRERLEASLKIIEEFKALLAQQNGQIQALESHDPVSGCLNKATFLHRISEEFLHLSGAEQGLSLLVVRIENLSQIGRMKGPDLSDELLRRIGTILTSFSKKGDLTARIGVEDFCVAYKDTKVLHQFEICEHLIRQISENTDSLMTDEIRLNVGFGWAHSKQAPQSLRQMLNEAFSAVSTTGSTEPSRHDGQRNQQLATTYSGKVHAPTSIKPAASEQTDNIEHFRNAVESAISLAKGENRPLAMMKIKMLGARYLREAIGEQLFGRLCDVLEQRLTAGLQGNVARLVNMGEGEFAICLDQINSEKDVAFVARKLLDNSRQPVDLDGKQTYVKSQAGIAMYPDQGRDCQELLINSATALSRALSHDSRADFRLFDASMIEESRTRLEIESGLREALEKNQFELNFQPIVDARTRELCAAETLLRATHPYLRSVRIDTIIEVAEMSSLIAELDMWVFTEALRQMGEWSAAGVALPKISINISADQLINDQFMNEIFEKIKTAAFSASQVQVEVTETAKLTDLERAAGHLKRLQRLGVFIALDDFGTGQASLTYLQRLHPDVIKIDRSFVTGVNSNHANATLVSAMTVLAHCLGLRVVVEGIETEQQLEFLRDTQCDEIQGYFISKPLSSKDFKDWVKFYVDANGAKLPSRSKEQEAQIELQEPVNSDAA